MNKDPMRDPEGRTKIEQLEHMLESENKWGDEQIEIEILPNGEIRQLGNHENGELKPNQKPLTFREDLGGEYAGPCSC
jgi:hypothetical protein